MRRNDQLQLALIGCGGRGGGAVANAMAVKSCPIKLVAMADVFDDRLNACYYALSQNFGPRIDVPPERKYIGFDAYRHAMDCLKPGDIAIFTTPLAFRWVHFAYAIEKGLNVFMEKPLTADGPSLRKMFKLAEEASAKKLKVGVGLMCRHSRSMEELQRRIQDGQIGDVMLMRGYRMQGPLATAFSEKWPGEPSELLWQISRFHSFIWASGGCFSDFNVHHIDHLCWMKNDWPVKAVAIGARHYRQSRKAICMSIRILIPTPWNTRLPTAPSCIWTGVAWRGAPTSIPATRTAARAWPSWRPAAILGTTCLPKSSPASADPRQSPLAIQTQAGGAASLR